MERKFDESRNEVRQVMAELEMLQRTIDQRNQQVEPLENEIQLQVGLYFLFYFFTLSRFTNLQSITGNLFSLRIHDVRCA